MAIEMPGHYGFFDHTGDMGIELRARTLDGLFEAAAAALTEVLWGRSPVRLSIVETLTLEAADREMLLIDWLSELAYRAETKRWVVGQTTVQVQDGPELVRLRARIDADRFDPARHVARTLVKGVTYHGLFVRRIDDSWRARVILDV